MPNLMMGKVVVITGGASGLGQATALAFAREGANVVIGDVDVKGAQETIEAIRSNGGAGISMRVDVTKAADVQQMIAAAVDRYGGLDYAFNNAGFVGSTAGVVDTTEEDWRHAIATNLTSVWLCIKYEIPEMLKRQIGRASCRERAW